MDVLASHLKRVVNEDAAISAVRLARVGQMVNWIVKVRGWKAIGRFLMSVWTYFSPLLPLRHPASPHTNRSSLSAHFRRLYEPYDFASSSRLLARRLGTPGGPSSLARPSPHRTIPALRTRPNHLPTYYRRLSISREALRGTHFRNCAESNRSRPSPAPSTGERRCIRGAPSRATLRADRCRLGPTWVSRLGRGGNHRRRA